MRRARSLPVRTIPNIEPNWGTATWEGSRRAQLRAALALTVRERLQALDGLVESSQRLAAMPRTQGRDAESGAS